MTAKIVCKHGGEVVVNGPGDEHYRDVYKPHDADVTANADGSYSIPAIENPQDLDLACTRETQTFYEYDSAKKAWWKWSA